MPPKTTSKKSSSSSSSSNNPNQYEGLPQQHRDPYLFKLAPLPVHGDNDNDEYDGADDFDPAQFTRKFGTSKAKTSNTITTNPTNQQQQELDVEEGEGEPRDEIDYDTIDDGGAGAIFLSTAAAAAASAKQKKAKNQNQLNQNDDDDNDDDVAAGSDAGCSDDFDPDEFDKIAGDDGDPNSKRNNRKNNPVHLNFMASLPLAVRRRVDHLLDLDEQYVDVRREHDRRILELRRAFEREVGPILLERRAIISGTKAPALDLIRQGMPDAHREAGVEIGIAEGEGGDNSAQQQQQEKQPSSTSAPMSGFWLKALQHHVVVRDMITERDAEILQHCTDISIASIEPQYGEGFIVRFEFAASNPFFKNKVLVKTFHTKDDDETDDMVVDFTSGTRILWTSPEHNVTTKIITHKVRAKQGKNNSSGSKKGTTTRTVKKQVRCDSFFRFFFDEITDPQDAELENAYTFEPVDEEQWLGLGLVLMDKIVPYAVEYFTGEAPDGKSDVDCYGSDGGYSDDDDDDDDYEQNNSDRGNYSGDDNDADDDPNDKFAARRKQLQAAAAKRVLVNRAEPGSAAAYFGDGNVVSVNSAAASAAAAAASSSSVPAARPSGKKQPQAKPAPAASKPAAAPPSTTNDEKQPQKSQSQSAKNDSNKNVGGDAKPQPKPKQPQQKQQQQRSSGGLSAAAALASQQQQQGKGYGGSDKNQPPGDAECKQQ